jgi:hypothetical protein
MDVHQHVLVLNGARAPQVTRLVRKLRAGLGGLLLGSAAACLAAEPTWEINVIGDMTEAGRKLPPPSPAEPTIYAPLVIGYRAEGDRVAGEKPPPPKDEILAQLAKTLAQQGYLVADPRRPEPKVLLLFSWGSLNPSFDPVETEVTDVEKFVSSEPGTSVKVLANSKEMRALVAGNTTKNMPLVAPTMRNRDLDDVRSDMLEDRYFVTVVAFDWQAAKEHKKVLLWSTKMSVPSRRVTMAQVIPALIKAGAPFIGRETKLPQRIDVPAIRGGQVEVGTPEVVREPAPDRASAAPEGRKE